ncbi:hypothetical protein PR202_ga03029 [Eleusine coracana subsp. coracana]|uniref:RING-type domain-containing protein n=1 Tax=Eleusine coracana subsp. coracana TaxID=191504 RepID=A0AAV5BLA4_ELECO|nr:hypothetical protein PR202_ga03029 [Eleusine coracana subsp. coracana]
MESLSRNGDHSDPSCSASVYKSFRPVTRSMTRVPAAIVASPDLKGGGSASTSTSKSISDASFSIQSAALRPAVTRARTPHKVTISAWKPLTHPVALSEGQKCASLTTMNPTAKRSRVASTRVAKDFINHSASKASPIVHSGKKNRDEETISQGDQFDASVMPSPTKKLQTCKFPSDTCSKRVSSIRILGGKVPAPVPTGKFQTETGKNPADVPAKLVSTSANDTSLSADAAVPLPAQQLQPDTAKNSSVIRVSVKKEASQVQPLSSKVVNLRTGKFQTETGKASVSAKLVSASANDISLSADAAVPLPQQLQPDTAKTSSVVRVSVKKEASQVQPLSAKVVNLPRQKLQTDYQKTLSNVPMTTNQVSGLAGATAPTALPKLQIGNVKDTSNVLSNPAYARALLIKQQQQLLQQYNLGSSQQQQELYIKGPALPWSDETPPIVPLGTRCDLCKLDVAFRPQGDAGRDASAPPVVAVLACHHAFHSSCIEAVYGLVEPSQCIACVEAGVIH